MCVYKYGVFSSELMAVPSSDYVDEESFKTIILDQYASGRSVANSTRRYDLAHLVLNYPQRPWNTWRPLVRMRKRLRGPAGLFTFEDYLGWDDPAGGVGWDNLFVGLGDGSRTAFNAPFRAASDVELYDADALVSSSAYDVITNLLATPNEFFTDWDTTSAGPTAVTPGQADPDGGTSASRLDFIGPAPCDWLTITPNTYASGIVGKDIVVELSVSSPSGAVEAQLIAGEKLGSTIVRTARSFTARPGRWERVRCAHTATLVGGDWLVGLSFPLGSTPAPLLVHVAVIYPGEDGTAVIDCDSAPTTGHPLDVSFIGRRIFTGRFGDDRLARTVGPNDWLTELTLPIQEEPEDA
jgi:hypothetical protein